MGSTQSYISEATVATFVIAGAAAVAYSYTNYGPQSSSQPSVSEPARTSGKNRKKKKAGAQLGSSTETTAANPVVVPFPAVIPGDFDTPSAFQEAESVTKPAKAKKKKAKKAAGAGASRSPVDAMSESSATAPESQVSTSARPTAKSRKSSTPKPPSVDVEESWTRVDSRRRNDPSQAAPAEAGTSDAGITTTSMTGNSSPTAGRSDDEEMPTRTRSTPETRRPLAERLLPKPRKTGVDDMLETPDYPKLSRVMRIQPGPNDTPAAGFSWADYEDVDDPRGTADDADGEDDGGWGVVKGRNRAKVHRSPSQTPSAPETLTKKQRQNAVKREAQKTAKADAEVERQARLAKHKRELEREKIAELYGKSDKTAYVDEKGKLVWK